MESSSYDTSAAELLVLTTKQEEWEQLPRNVPEPAATNWTQHQGRKLTAHQSSPKKKVLLNSYLIQHNITTIFLSGWLVITKIFNKILVNFYGVPF